MAVGVDKSLLHATIKTVEISGGVCHRGRNATDLSRLPQGGGVPIFRAQCRYRQSRASALPQLVKKLAYGDFFDDFCTVCLGAYGSPGGKRR